MATNESMEKKLDNLMNGAYDKANSMSSKYVHLEHILWSFLHLKQVESFFKQEDIDYEAMISEVDEFLATFPLLEHKSHSTDKMKLSKHAQVFLSYYSISLKCNENIILTNKMKFIVNVIASMLLMTDTISQKILLTNKVDNAYLLKIYQENSDSDTFKQIAEAIMNDGETEPQNDDKFLQTYTINLTKKVSSKDWMPIIGREKELELMQQIMLRIDKPNLIMVGNPGIGKTKLVEGFAKIYKDKFPNMVVYQLDTLAFTSNVLLKGEIENRVKNLYNAIKKKGNVILYIDEIHSIFGNPDSNGQSEISNLLKPLLTDSILKIIGTTTQDEFRKYMEKDDAFMRRFFKMVINESSEEETYKIINSSKIKYENAFDIKFTEKNIKLIMDLCKRYFMDKYFPDKAFDILDMVGAYAKYNNEKIITDNMIYKIISSLLNIPLENLSKSDSERLQTLENTVKKEIIGQDEAIQKFSDAIIISKSGLRETNKTATSLMFLGSSGCGKTECCRVMSKIMNMPLIRFDMSEYMEEHSVSKLIGAPPGYKGFGDGKSGNGLLINAIDEHPNCILLLDEIEKANSKIHNILLQVMDNGKLTSSSGKSVSFEHVYLVMTSNTGSNVSHKQHIGFGFSEQTSMSEEAFNQSFLPEFRSRIDSVITFNKLDDNTMNNICKKFLNELKDILTKKDVDFSYNDDIVNYIVNKAKLANNGARPLKHIITNEIKNIIAKNIVLGKYINNNKIKLSIKEDKVDFGE